MENLTNTDRLKLPDLIGRLSQVENGSRQWVFLWKNFDKLITTYLWKVCLNSNSIRLKFTNEEIADLISDSKGKIYSNLQSLQIPEGSSTKDQDLMIKGWMGKILHNQAYTILENSKKLLNFILPLDENIADSAAFRETDDELSPEDCQQLEQINNAIQHLAARDQDIFYTYTYNRHHNGRIDDYLLRGLEKKYNLAPGYSSKIYARSIEKIKKTINKHQNGKASQKDTGDDEVSG